MISSQQARFEDLYRRHLSEVWALAYSTCLNAESALDITQETFLRLWRQYRDGERIDRPWGWLRRVAGNLAKDHNKSMFRRNGTHPPEVMNGLRSEEPMPLERLEREEAFARLRAALAELPSRDREILTLRYGLGYSNQEVADLLDLNIHAVYMRACRARQRLAGSLTEPGVTSPA